MTTFTDTHTGKIYKVAGTTVTQHDGKPCFIGQHLYLWGKEQAVTDFKSSDALNSWLKMMGFRG